MVLKIKGSKSPFLIKVAELSASESHLTLGDFEERIKGEVLSMEGEEIISHDMSICKNIWMTVASIHLEALIKEKTQPD